MFGKSILVTRHTHQMLVDCLKVPSLLPATQFAIFAAYLQGIWEMKGLSPRIKQNYKKQMLLKVGVATPVTPSLDPPLDTG